MIEDYLATSRRVKPATEALVSHYKAMYECLLAFTKEHADSPELHVTYSAERRCELITVRGRTYLVYDQYLGQTFNRLNRIQYAIRGEQDLSRALASKYLAERLLCLGLPVMAGLLGIAAIQFENNVKAGGNPFQFSPENETSRLNITGAQELFIMAHELAHFRFSLDEARSGEETWFYINEFLDHKRRTHSELPTMDGGEDADAAAYYVETLQSQDCIPEMFADDLGGIIAFRAATMSLEIPAWQAVEGIVLGFKYLRLFQHLEVMAHRLCEVAMVADPTLFKESLNKLSGEVWDKAHGLKIAQLREHFLRYRLWTASECAVALNNEGVSNISDLIGEYDEKTEFPVVFDLVDRLRDNLTPEMLMEFAEQAPMKQNATAMIDKLTGWAK